MTSHHSIMESPAAEAMTWDRWQKMNATQKAAYRTPPTPPMMAEFLGKQVEVVDFQGHTRSFTVGISEGWQPAYLELVDGRIAQVCDQAGYAIVICRESGS